MRWMLSTVAASGLVGLAAVAVLYAWYGSLSPCEIFKRGYLQHKSQEVDLVGAAGHIGRISVSFVYERFISNYIASASSWQCLKDLGKIRTNSFDNFRETALGESLGDQVPDFVLPSIPGLPNEGPSSDDLRAGQPTVINFFASWCVPCRIEAPLLQRLSESQDIRLLGINYMDKPADALTWLSTYGDPYDQIGMDQSGEASLGWRLSGLPETFIVDGSGTIVYRHPGAVDLILLEIVVLPLLDELSKGLSTR